MHRSLLTAGLLCGIAVYAPAARADSPAEARKAIQSAYDRLDAAAGRKDTSGMLASYTPDYTLTMKSGMVISGQTMKQQMARNFAMMKSVKSKSTIQKLTINGSQAAATTNGHIVLTLIDPRTNKMATIVVNAVTQDTWVKTGGGWREKHSQEISTQQSMDGKPLPSR